jgi:hypothetical protein
VGNPGAIADAVEAALADALTSASAPAMGSAFCAQYAADPGDGFDGVEFLRADTHRGWGIASMARAAARWARFS